MTTAHKNSEKKAILEPFGMDVKGMRVVKKEEKARGKKGKS